MPSTRLTRFIRAPCAAVYRSLLDAAAIEAWRVPDGMTCKVHAFDARVGGSFRISLTYDAPDAVGKTSAHTETCHGRFVGLVPDRLVVEKVEFETNDPAMRGEMTITWRLDDADGGTGLHATHDDLPPGVPLADNETGWGMALAKLAAYVESGQ